METQFFLFTPSYNIKLLKFYFCLLNFQDFFLIYKFKNNDFQITDEEIFKTVFKEVKGNSLKPGTWH